MKQQVITYLVIGFFGTASAFAVAIGEPAHADIAISQVAGDVIPQVIAFSEE